MYECFHCLQRTVVWDADFTFEDYGIEGEGLINHCHCTNCGAEIDYFVPITEEDEAELKERYGYHYTTDNKELAEKLMKHLDKKRYTRETWDAINEILQIVLQKENEDE